jgi:hypothetical protein
MPNSTKATLAIVSIIILISGVFVLTKSRPSEVNLNSNITSSSVSISTISSVLSTKSSISSLLISSSSQSEAAKVVEAPKVETAPKVDEPKSKIAVIDQGSNPNPIQDIPNVTKLSTDKSIYWQYIKDYLACPTKFYQPLNGGYIYEGLDQYQYLCIPQSEIEKCPKGILQYGLKPEVGSTVFTTKNETILENKYYCRGYVEGATSATLPEAHYQNEIPRGITKTLPNYFIIPKYDYNTKTIASAAIPIESFSKDDQEYIAKNFSTK